MIKIKIKDVKTYLINHPWYFSDKNNCEISEIVSQNKYYFNSDCGHEPFGYPCNLVNEDGIHCNICSGKVVLNGFNDLATKRPDLIQFLKNKEDGYKYTGSSNQIVQWKCPNCGYEWDQQINRMNLKINLCPNCSNKRSFGEKFFSCFLDQLYEIYEQNVTFDWSDKKQYDFWLIERNMIIEVHGKQHFEDTFAYKKARNLYEEQMNDEYKMELAIKNGIGEYVVIDCRKSDKDYIKSNIMTSLLPTLLNFSSDEIDWDRCGLFGLNNTIYDVCKDYDSGYTIRELINNYNRSRNTIISYLKKGTAFNWCNYDIEKIKKENNIRKGQRVIATMSKKVCQLDENGNIIRIYNSIQEAQRISKIRGIWRVAVGQRKTAGGFRWIYLEEYNQDKMNNK